MPNHIFKVVFLFLTAIFFISCSGSLTEKEKATIEKYTKNEQHDSRLFGKWMNNKTFKHQKKDAHIAISFDAEGINNERMYGEGEPFNNWHLLYYYHTKQGKVFMYHPAQKGFMAMDGEIFLEYDYKISEDGKSLKIGDNVYSKLDD